MSRLWVSIFTLVIYGLAQVGPIILKAAGVFNSFSNTSQTYAIIFSQVILFVLAAIIITFLHNKIANPTKLELQTKGRKRYILLWAIGGFFIVMIYQIFAGMINIYVLGAPNQSPNTERIMAIARKVPLFIILISVVGPILEEYVFRKVIFGELYNIIKGNKTIKFIIAGVVSATLFAFAHSDPAFFIIYFGMGLIFAGFYAYTKRIWVPILIHVFQNGLVVIIQVLVGPEKIKEMQNATSFIIHFIN